MATIDSQKIIDDIITGKYADDNPTRIVSYRNFDGKLTYGVTFGAEDRNKYLVRSHYIREPMMFWDIDKDGYRHGR
jgi:hypothetical protein